MTVTDQQLVQVVKATVERSEEPDVFDCFVAYRILNNWNGFDEYVDVVNVNHLIYPQLPILEWVPRKYGEADVKKTIRCLLLLQEDGFDIMHFPDFIKSRPYREWVRNLVNIKEKTSFLTTDEDLNAYILDHINDLSPNGLMSMYEEFDDGKSYSSYHELGGVFVDDSGGHRTISAPQDFFFVFDGFSRERADHFAETNSAEIDTERVEEIRRLYGIISQVVAVNVPKDREIPLSFGTIPFVPDEFYQDAREKISRRRVMTKEERQEERRDNIFEIIRKLRQIPELNDKSDEYFLNLPEWKGCLEQKEPMEDMADTTDKIVSAFEAIVDPSKASEDMQSMMKDTAKMLGSLGSHLVEHIEFDERGVPRIWVEHTSFDLDI